VIATDTARGRELKPSAPAGKPTVMADANAAPFQGLDIVTEKPKAKTPRQGPSKSHGSRGKGNHVAKTTAIMAAVAGLLVIGTCL
jgi:hypothetical protein